MRYENRKHQSVRPLGSFFFHLLNLVNNPGYFCLFEGMRDKKILLAKGVLLIIHMVGIIGLSFPDLRPYFLSLTPLTLLISAISLFYFHENWNKAFITFLILCYAFGYGIEVVGVATGLVFGDYSYSAALGPKLVDTPLMIGINWLFLIYATGTIANTLNAPTIIKALSGAVLMLVLDLALEPVAIALNFWEWPGDSVPVLNYAAWFFISFLLLLLFYLMPFQKGNRFALFLYLVQLLFFILLGIIL